MFEKASESWPPVLSLPNTDIHQFYSNPVFRPAEIYYEVTPVPWSMCVVCAATGPLVPVVATGDIIPVIWQLCCQSLFIQHTQHNISQHTTDSWLPAFHIMISPPQTTSLYSIPPKTTSYSIVKRKEDFHETSESKTRSKNAWYHISTEVEQWH